MSTKNMMMEIPLSVISYAASTYYNIQTLETSITRLIGYDDANYLIEDSSTGEKFVMKIVNPDASKQELTDVIDEILKSAYDHCEARSLVNFEVPRLIETTGEKSSTLMYVRYATDFGQEETCRCNVKLSSYYRGSTLMELVNKIADLDQLKELYESLGLMVSNLSQFMSRQRHLLSTLKVLRVGFEWQLMSCADHVRQLAEKFYPDTNAQRRQLLERALRNFEKVEVNLKSLPDIVMHGDLSTRNILAKDTGARHFCLIDFQDLQIGPSVAELAMMILYGVLEAEQVTLERALSCIPRWIYSGYSRARSRLGDDLELSWYPDYLVPLMSLRLCQSLLNGQVAFAMAPKNEYVMHTNQRGWHLLELLVQDRRYRDRTIFF